MLSGAVGIGWLALLLVAGVGYWLWDRHKGAGGRREATGRRVRPSTGRRQYRDKDEGRPAGGGG